MSHSTPDPQRQRARVAGNARALRHILPSAEDTCLRCALCGVYMQSSALSWRATVAGVYYVRALIRADLDRGSSTDDGGYADMLPERCARYGLVRVGATAPGLMDGTWRFAAHARCLMLLASGKLGAAYVAPAAHVLAVPHDPNPVPGMPQGGHAVRAWVCSCLDTYKGRRIPLPTEEIVYLCSVAPHLSDLVYLIARDIWVLPNTSRPV